MRNIVLLLLLFTLTANGQTNFTFNTNCFLLGLIEDYNGRTIVFEKSESVSYIASVLPEHSKLFLDSIAKVYGVPKEEIRCKGNSFFNRKIADQINDYFTAEIDPNTDVYDEETGKSYAVYFLRLNEKKFKTSGEKLSFLTGMFYNCGSLVNDEVVFKTANSPNFYVAVRFISALGFAYCEEAKTEYSVPTTQVVTFKPSSTYIAYFKNLESRRQNGW